MMNDDDYDDEFGKLSLNAFLTNFLSFRVNATAIASVILSTAAVLVADGSLVVASDDGITVWAKHR